VPRWDPNTRLRLVEAALDLFEERGYDATSVQEIAERARVTKATFYRQFADKREVFAAGREERGVLLARAVAASPDSVAPLRAVEEALSTLASSYSPDRRLFTARVLAVTACHDELRERSELVYAGYTAAIREALALRGIPETTAAVAAELGVLAFRIAIEDWSVSEVGSSLELLVREALNDVVVAAWSFEPKGAADRRADAGR
jgi:AcrR family transcriptional regulator